MAEGSIKPHESTTKPTVMRIYSNTECYSSEMIETRKITPVLERVSAEKHSSPHLIILTPIPWSI